MLKPNDKENMFTLKWNGNRDVRHEDIPEINNPKIRFPVLEGDKLMKEVLNGGYNVHPVPAPNSEINERIRKRYERDRIKIEKLLTLG
jgi:hypothetical protein